MIAGVIDVVLVETLTVVLVEILVPLLDVVLVGLTVILLDVDSNVVIGKIFTTTSTSGSLVTVMPMLSNPGFDSISS